MPIFGHYDREADIAWLHVDGYNPNTAVAEETDAGLREFDPGSAGVVGLEFWQASRALPADLLRMLPSVCDTT